MKKVKSQRGVALVITLIMLAIITVVAVIFLGVARRNRAGITVQQDQVTAEFAAEAALQRAKIDFIAQIKSSKQLLGYDLVTSRGGDLWTSPGRLRDPYGDSNGPVLVNTNYAGTKSTNSDPRHYLDLNRNGEFEATFITTNVFTNTVGTVFTNVVAVPGDPEWIFIPDRPERPYGPDNTFIARMAYIVVPAGKALDINTIHNANWPQYIYPLQTNATPYLRNQGVGSWEMNLAALLHELDLVQWTYGLNFDPNAKSKISPKLIPPDGVLLVPTNGGSAFFNASNFVVYRTNASGMPTRTLNWLFGPEAQQLRVNQVDDLGNDLPIGGTYFGLEDDPSLNQDGLDLPFAGADALRHYFTHQDLFDQTKTSLDFVRNLRSSLTNASNQPHTNGYKFYELLSELATDTGTENRNRINLNWAKLDPLTPWDVPTNKNLALNFFTNAAQRILNTMTNDFRNMLATNAGVIYTNSVTDVNRIMIAPGNFYQNSVHRIMQLAANIYDASRSDEFPTVFRPVFGTINNTNFIVGWTNDSSYAGLNTWLSENTNGIPLVVGAKKGFPNFNEYTFRTDMIVTRKLQMLRPSPTSLPSETNQMYIMGVSNVAVVEAWNSYLKPFQYGSIIEISNTVTYTLTNYAGVQGVQTLNAYSITNIPANAWPGFPGPNDGLSKYSFQLPLMTNLVILSNSVYRAGVNRFEQVGTNQFERGLTQPFYLPNWNLVISNQLVYVQRVGGNIIDFVILRDNSVIDLSSNLTVGVALSPPSAPGNVWDTNRYQGNPLFPTEGLRAQIAFSQRSGTDSDWTSYGTFSGSFQGINSEREALARGFRDFMGGKSNAPTIVETPFNPVARLLYTKTWQANDPLVHYHPADLTAFYPSVTLEPIKWRDPNVTNFGPASIGSINKGYAPWGNTVVNDDPNSFDYRMRDPGVSSSDKWNFPTNKYASVGWLGRVHRGTPWQTIYFKAGGDAGKGPLSYAQWVSHANMFQNHPTNDIRLADIFTTALTDQAAQGLLSINQTHLGAWSAALSGVVVISNWLSDDIVMDSTYTGARFTNQIIAPTGGNTNSGVFRIWNAVQAERIRVGGVFRDFSQILALPELTTQSPFLYFDPDNNQRQQGIDDAAYERIPQQILGLLRVGQPRVVIYAYGQALKPERVDPNTRKVVNYQITAEFATRTVLRLDGDAQSPRVVVEAFNILPPD